MSNWMIIVPESTTNKFLNPSAETTGNFAAEAGTTVTRSTTYGKYGLYSYRIETNANNEGVRLTMSALANAIHYVTVRVRGTLPAAWDWSVDNTNWTVPTKLEDIDADWDLYGAQFPAAQCNGQTTFRVHQNGAGSGDFYLDGVQVEEKSYWTSYCDGDQDGCEWIGADDASASKRSAQSRAGGRVKDLKDDYNFGISDYIGTGTPPHRVNVDEYALLPGGELNSIKTRLRPFTLAGTLTGSACDLYAARQDLVKVLAPETYAKEGGRYQPVRLRFEGATVHKEIAAHYTGGLEAQIKVENKVFEKLGLRFLAIDPSWYELGESALSLDSNDSATIRFVAARLRSTGQWDDLGSPGGAIASNGIQAIAEDDTYVYWGGSFTDFNGDASADRIVRYNKGTQAWSNIGAANGNVLALTIGPDGFLYAGGAFTDIGGTAMNRVGVWNGTTWAALGTGLNNFCYALAFGLDGTLYVGGTFTTAGGSGANRIASWDGSSWSNLGTGTNGTYVSSIAIHSNGDPYIGGDFTTANGVSCARIAMWNGTTFVALGSGLNSYVNIGTMAFGSNAILYVGGNFTTAGGVTVNYIAQWNGTAFTDLAGGADAQIQHVAIAPDGKVFICGGITQIGGLDIISDAAFWNGSSWAHLDCEIGAVSWEVVVPSERTDPVTGAYDLWAGVTTSSANFTMYYGGKVSITNDGTGTAYPVFIFKRSGGTTATLYTIRNETTNKELLFDYDLLDSEQLTIDLHPTQQSIVSSKFGSRMDAVLPNSDFGTFNLQPGDNNITCFIYVAGAPTITAYAVWQDTYKSFD